jgi:hypothetical protein
VILVILVEVGEVSACFEMYIMPMDLDVPKNGVKLILINFLLS